MSETPETAERKASNSHGERAIPILKEYSEKLQVLTNEVKRLQSDAEKDKADATRRKARAEYDLMRQLYLRLRPAGVKLVQNVSQQVQFAKLDDMIRLELGLRLAEFEHALQAAEQVIARGI